MEHSLKIGKERLKNLIVGKKKCEVRFNDRDYQGGDILVFYDDGKEVKFLVTHIHSGLGVQPGYVVLSVDRVYD